MIYYIAVIRNSQVESLKFANADPEPEGVREDGSTIVHIDFPIEDRYDFVSTWCWDGDWYQRDPRPNRFAEWDGSQWVWDDADLLNELRNARNARLTACDWTRMDDNGLTDAKRDEWATYRQALRDITKDYDSLDSVIWPESP